MCKKARGLNVGNSIRTAVILSALLLIMSATAVALPAPVLIPDSIHFVYTVDGSVPDSIAVWLKNTANPSQDSLIWNLDTLADFNWLLSSVDSGMVPAKDSTTIYLKLDPAVVATYTADSSGLKRADLVAIDYISSVADSLVVTLEIRPPLLIVSDTVLNEWTINQPGYSDFIIVDSTTGQQPYAWSITSGSLPTGLTLVDSTGEIRDSVGGPPTGPIEITVTDDAGFSVAKTFTIVINNPISITTADNALPQWAAGGDPYAFQLGFSAGTAPITWDTLPSPNLPPGVNVSSSGLISGVPGAAGTFKPKIVVRSAAGDTAYKTFDPLLIHAAPLIATSSPLPEWTSQHPGYSKTLTTQQTAFTPQWNITLGGLDSNMTLDQSTGLISGQPLDTIGTYVFTVQVSDGAGNTNDKVFNLTINETLSITTNAVLPPITANAWYNQQLTATGGTGKLYWDLHPASAPLPDSLDIDSTGLLSGTPTTANTYPFRIRLQDSVGALTSKNFSLTVNPVIQITSPGNLGVTILDSTFSIQLTATGGTGNLTWTDNNNGLVGTGLTLQGDGLLTGTPGVAQSVSFTGLVIDTDGGRDSVDFTLKVDGPPVFGPEPTNTLQQICEGESLVPITATDPNSDEVVFSIKTGTLPGDLALNTDGSWSDTANYESADTNYLVIIKVCDLAAPELCSEITLEIDVCNTNRSPEFPDSVLYDTIQEGGTPDQVTATDPDTANSLTYTPAGACNLPGNLTLNADGSFSGDAQFGTDGEYICSLKVCDDDPDSLLCDTAVLRLTVLPDTIPPFMVGPPTLTGTTVSQVFQDDGAGVDTAFLEWRQGSSNSTSGTEVAMTGGGGQKVATLTATVPVSQGATTGLEVRYVVSDDKPSPNTDTTDWWPLSIPFAEQALTSPSNVWLDGADTLWHLVSIPGALDTFGVRYIFEQLSSLPRNNNSLSDAWRLVRFNSQTQEFNKLTSSDRQNMIQSGEGYWFRNHGAQFVLTLPAGATHATDSAFRITLNPGWNLFGNPFLFGVSILDTLIDSTKVSSFYRQGRPAGPGDAGWATAMTLGTDAIDPWRGYAVYNEDVAQYTIYLDPHYQPAPVAPGEGPETWITRVAVNSSGREVGAVILGRSSAGYDQPDIMDNRTLTFFGGKPVIELLSEEYGSFQKDIRGTEGVQEWKIEVQGEATSNLTLSWAADPLGGGEEALLLRDVVMDRLIDMTTQTSYLVPGPEQIPPGRFMVYQGAADEVRLVAAAEASTRPMTYRLYQNYPNPFNPTTSIAFDLPKASRVDLELFNILGEKVARLVSESRPAGSYSVPWDGRNTQGIRVASGMYFARLRAGEYHSTVKLVLIK